MANKKQKKSGMKAKVVSILNKSLIPLEFSYQAFKKLISSAKRTAPLIYEEVEHLVKNNIIVIKKRTQFLKKSHIEELGEKITSSLIKKIPTVDEKELKKIVTNRSSQNFIDILAKGLSVGTFIEKEYTLLPKEKKFQSVLIANRGEIALRIIRACRELGIKTILVYSKPDKDTLAVKFADKSYCIGPAVSYLDLKKIIKIASKS